MTTYTPKTKPFPHQTRAILRAVRARNYGVFFEPRLGKTKVAIDIANIHCLKSDEEEFKVLVLAPKGALAVWEDELETHCPLDYSTESYEWYEGDGETLQFFLAGREETFRASRDSHGRLHRPKQQALEDWNPHLIVIDESHEYKRPGGRAAQDAWRMVRRLRKLRGDGLPYVVLLSGTPNPKGWRDLFAQFRIIDDTIFGTSVADFDEDYCVFGKGARRFTVVKYKQVPRILKRIRENSIAVSAEAAGLAGHQSWTAIRVDLPDAVLEKYQKFSTDMLVELEGQELTAKNAGVKRLRCMQMAGGFLTDGTVVHREKLRATREWLDVLFAQKEPVIVYARFLPEVAALGQVVASVGYYTHVITGAVPQEERREAIREFQRQPYEKPVAMVFQIQTGKQAIELSRGAEVVYYSTPDGWVEYWQSLNRVLGPNQKRPVRYTHILARGTVDVSAMAGLRKKEDAHQTFMANPKRYLLGLIQ